MIAAFALLAASGRLSAEDLRLNVEVQSADGYIAKVEDVWQELRAHRRVIAERFQIAQGPRQHTRRALCFLRRQVRQKLAKNPKSPGEGVSDRAPPIHKAPLLGLD